jgi:hypothetical protein
MSCCVLMAQDFLAQAAELQKAGVQGLPSGFAWVSLCVSCMRVLAPHSSVSQGNERSLLRCDTVSFCTPSKSGASKKPEHKLWTFSDCMLITRKVKTGKLRSGGELVCKGLFLYTALSVVDTPDSVERGFMNAVVRSVVCAMMTLRC